MGKAIVEVLEMRDRGYVFVSGENYEGITPAAHLVPLTGDELDELGLEGDDDVAGVEMPEDDDDAESIERAAMELGMRAVAFRAQHGPESLRSIPVFGNALDGIATLTAAEIERLDELVEPAFADAEDEQESEEERETVRLGSGDLPRPGPLVAARARRPAAPVVAPAVQPVRAAIATTSPPVARPDALPPLVNGGGSSVVNGAAPRSPNPPVVTVTPPVRRADDPEPSAVAVATPPQRRRD